MQHINAELLRCESELRCLQCGVDGIEAEWRRVLSFFTSLQGRNFDVNRLPCGEEYKNKIQNILGKLAVEIDSEDVPRFAGTITVGWGYFTGATISINYTPGVSFQYRWKYRRAKSEASIDMNRGALVDLMRRIITEFDTRNGLNFSEWLVETFYDTVK